MCIFSFDPQKFGQVNPIHVQGTQIFVRGLTEGRQALVYSMQYSSQVDMAMVLPLPTPAAAREDAVDFIDLSEYDQFFDDMERGFPDVPGRSDNLNGAVVHLSIGDAPTRILEVHNVGSFEASFVPTRSDFVRLDARFRLPDSVLDALPIYRDYSFAVFKLKPGTKKVHPMAFSFPRRNTKELFFPTVHVHDGTVPEKAQFDHTLCCQFRSNLRSPGWESSHTWREGELTFEEWFQSEAKNYPRPIESYSENEKRLIRKLNYEGYGRYVESPANASQFMDIRRARGLVRDDALVQRVRVLGLKPNKDLVFADE